MALCLGVVSCVSAQKDKEDEEKRKYSDFLQLPHGLEGYFDYDEAVEAAQRENKPILIYVTGHACNNCREMEAWVWSDDQVLKMLREDFVICALYVDDKTKLRSGESLGKLNCSLAQKMWNINSHPAYIILSPDGMRVIAGPRGYNSDIEDYIEFLNKGNRIHQSFVEVGFDADSPNVKWEVSVKKESQDIYAIVFDATIREGLHGYPMSDIFSSPIFEIEGAELLGDVVEPLTPVEIGIDEITGEPAYIYRDRAVYIQRVRAKAGSLLNCWVNATICENDTNLCTSNIAEFLLKLP
ncbi:MAG: thioredoxin family protein [Alistipes sp.]|nr:thioredoxin family protein [Alistipes sp.]